MFRKTLILGSLVIVTGLLALAWAGGRSADAQTKKVGKKVVRRMTFIPNKGKSQKVKSQSATAPGGVWYGSGTIQPGGNDGWYVDCQGFNTGILSPLNFGALNIAVFDSANNRVAFNNNGSTTGTSVTWNGTGTYRVEVTTPGSVAVNYKVTVQ